jgi:nucleoside-diphosphate-sugar epimerase
MPSPRPDEQAVFTNNVMSAYQVLDAAGRGGVPRIVYVSSLSALGSPSQNMARRPDPCRSPRRIRPSPRTQPLDGFATPFSTERSRELLGFTAAYSWR